MGSPGHPEIDTATVEFAVTDEPWTLPADAIVVSVGGTFGDLGQALVGQFPDFEWPALFDVITPGRPEAVVFRSRRSGEQERPWLAILATPHGAEPDPTVETIRLATTTAVLEASTAGANSIVMPMLGTGVLGLDLKSVAAVAVPAAISAANTAQFQRIIFVTMSPLDEPYLRMAAEGRLRTPTRLEQARTRRAPFELAGGVSTDRVDPNVGIPLSQDQLGVAPYVSMLATVIADRNTPTPLSVGIFGEWGSGKSYFMGLLRHAVADLSRSRNAAYCTDIAQIGFNAWHYADSNLWASLGDEIFRQLAGPGTAPNDERKDLRAKLAQNLDLRQELEAKTKQARDTVADLQATVDTATESRRERAAKLITALRRSPELRRQLDSAWGKLGVREPIDQSKLLADELNGTLSEADALRRTSADRTGRLVVLIAALALIACAVVAALAPGIRSWLAGASGVLAVVFATGVSLLARARSGLRALRSLSDELRSGMKRTEETTEAMQALRAAEAEQRLAEAQLAEVVSHVGELGRQLSELAPGHRLYSFLASRVEDGSYHRNLGLISIIRKDFEQLVALLTALRDEPDKHGAHRPIDRIVLYIDDLDRCSPSQVVDVLQAVHLLLALDLFIVVIGVDPRWLLRSLHSHYEKILDDTADAGPWRMIPEDYLEKIINIPIVLPGMPGGSLTRLLMSMDVVHSKAGSGNEIAQRLTPEQTAPPTIDSEIGVEAGSEVDEQRRATTLDRPPRPLTQPELDLLSTLDVLVDTPREAKRLFNLYRMVRATRDLSDASGFLGEDDEPGEYQAVVVLLGLLTAHNRLLKPLLDTLPDPDNEIAGGLLHRPKDSDWHDFVGDCRPVDGRNRVVGALPDESVAGWTRLSRDLASVSKLVTLPDVSVFHEWVPKIRRFSYNLVSQR